jgi:hypothetical protein
VHRLLANTEACSKYLGKFVLAVDRRVAHDGLEADRTQPAAISNVAAKALASISSWSVAMEDRPSLKLTHALPSR